MSIKSALAGILILCTFVTGCSLSKGNKEAVVADKATMQKTMTKVQNDVNEIMDKDYDYILKNMGLPYCTTYYVNIEDINENTIDSLKDIRNSTNMRLVYPKYTSDHKLDKSALYIELRNNKVVEVQTYELSKYDIKAEGINQDIDIIVDMYEDTKNISLESIKDIDFNTYIGKELEELNSVANIEFSKFEVYDKCRFKMGMGYFLNTDDTNENKILTVLEEDNIIQDIKILEYPDSMKFIKNYLSEE